MRGIFSGAAALFQRRCLRKCWHDFAARADSIRIDTIPPSGYRLTEPDVVEAFGRTIGGSDLRVLTETVVEIFPEAVRSYAHFGRSLQLMGADMSGPESAREEHGAQRAVSMRERA